MEQKVLGAESYKLKWCEVVSFPLTCCMQAFGHICHINRMCIFYGNMVSQKGVKNHKLLRWSWLSLEVPLLPSSHSTKLISPCREGVNGNWISRMAHCFGVNDNTNCRAVKNQFHRVEEFVMNLINNFFPGDALDMSVKSVWKLRQAL